MRQRFVLGALSASLALALAACGGGDGSTGPTFGDSISTADAQDFADGVASYASNVANGLNFNGPSIGLAAPAMYARAMARLQPMPTLGGRLALSAPDFSMLTPRAQFSRPAGAMFSAAEGCSYSSHGLDNYPTGNPIDLNGNGIPDDVGVRIECQLTDSTSAVDTVTVQYLLEEVSISEIAGSLWGEQIFEHVKQRVSNNVGQFQQVELTANGKTDIRSGSAVDQANFAVTQSIRLDSITHTASAGENYSNSFDPNGTITLGGPLPDGALTIGGNQYYTDTDANNVSFGIQTTTPLAFNAACYGTNTNLPFTAGALKGMLNNNANQASFTITFTACNTAPTITTSGTHDPVTVAAR